MPNYIEEAVAKIREQGGSDEAIMGPPGGADSRRPATGYGAAGLPVRRVRSRIHWCEL